MTVPSKRNTPSLIVRPAMDLRRRQLLRAGVGLAIPPWLPGCGSGPAPGTGGAPDSGSLPRDCVLPATATATTPRGLHASFTGDPVSTRTLTWFTDGPEDPGTFVEYGPVWPDMSAQQIACAPFPARAAGEVQQTHGVDALTHAATLAALQPGLPVRYRVGAPGAWSDVRVLPAAPQGAFRFCHFGDHGRNDASLSVLDGVAALQPDFFIVAGDLSYANGDHPQWDDWFNRLDPYASRIPMLTAPGNHEAEDNGGKAYKSRISQPGLGFRYGFDYGNVYFLFSTGGSLVGGNLAQDVDLIAELAWMEGELARAAERRARGEIDFIVLVQHFTIWTDQEGREPANLSLVLLEEGKLLRYGVDLALVGHDHIYQRSLPMGRGRPREDGYIQVTGGAGGQGLRGFAPISDWSATDAIRYCFTEYLVDGPRLSAVTWAVDRPDNSLTGGELTEIDRFEIQARDPVARRAFERSPEPNLNAEGAEKLLEHTRRRNAQHHRGEP